MKFATNCVRLVAALLNHQTPEKLFTAAFVVPFTGFVGLALIKLLSYVIPLLAVLLVAWGLLLFGLGVVKVLTQPFRRFPR